MNQSGLLVIFGITGDLTRRYLLPALYHLDDRGSLADEFEIIGVTRRELDAAQLIESLTAELTERQITINQATLTRLSSRLRLVTMDPGQPADYPKLKAELDRLEDERGVCLNRLFYLSLPPGVYGPVVDNLGASGLATGCQHGTADARIMVEKPFGYDLASATELITRIHKSFNEDQIYRIDHYLAKETAQNILTFRFANPIFQAVWDRQYITGLTITASETIGIEGRAAFYDNVGALRDFAQNHLLQLLAITTMAQPKTLDATHIHAAKLKLLEAITPISPTEVNELATRGQYQGYRAEVANPDSTTETFARLQLAIDNDTWRGVPITLQTGKRLDRRATTITLSFTPSADSTGLANTLTFRIQPNEGIAVEFQAKTPGLDNQTQTVEMSFNYRDSFAAAPPDAYERVLLDGIRGDQTLFTTSAEVLASWRIVEAVVAAWSKSSAGLITYEPGTPADMIGD